MLLIFRLSSQGADESNGLSLGIAGTLINFINNVFHMDFPVSGSLNHIVRKTAHFTAYLILGILSSNALRTSGVRGWKRLCISLALCVVYAASDEVHQVFVSGRSGQPADVLIDSSGAVVGAALSLLAGRWFKRSGKAR